MRAVGSYGDYLLLREDARHYEDVRLVIEGEGLAAKLGDLKSRAKGGR